MQKLRDTLAMANETTKTSIENFNRIYQANKQKTAEIERLTKKVTTIAAWCETAEANEKKLAAELEIERQRLVACGVAAMCNTRYSAEQQRLSKDSPLFCQTVKDVHDAVDREMALRADLEQANDRSFRASEAHVVTMGHLTDALDRLEDMLKADDGQAWKEAEKFLLRHRGTKVCIKCGCDMIPMHSEDKKLCSNGACGHEVEWKLSEGQQYQYKRNVEPFVEDRSNAQEELEPPRANLERL
jgi:NADH pyrophosphatase NudC (nudix superfamily)